ncbi:hypothetical protein [Shouchella sp. 1P01AA]
MHVKEVPKNRLFQFGMNVFNTMFVANLLGHLIYDHSMVLERLPHMVVVSTLIALFYTFGGVKVKEE